MTWYRNVKGQYHKPESTWIRSGLAVCGADISRPAYASDAYFGGLADLATRGKCAKCLAQDKAERPGAYTR